MEPIAQTKKPTLLLTSITLLFSYIFAIYGVMKNFYNPFDIFIAYSLETVIIFFFIFLRGLVSTGYSMNVFIKNHKPTRGDYIRFSLLFTYLFIMFSIFFIVLFFTDLAMFKAIFDNGLDFLQDIFRLKGILLTLIVCNLFLFFIDFISNKKYIGFYDRKDAPLLVKSAFNRLIILQSVLFLFFVITFFTPNTGYLLIIFLVLRYVMDLKISISAQSNS